MIAIPYERLTIHTQLSTGEVSQKLEDVVAPDYYQGEPTQKRPYRGEIDGWQFKIRRNSFWSKGRRLPRIEGDIQPEVKGCLIGMTVHPRTMDLVSAAIVGGIPACIVFVSVARAVVASIRLGEWAWHSFPSLGELIGLAAWLIWCYLVVWGSVKLESIRTRSFFCPLFQATGVDEFGTANLIKRWLQGDRDSSWEER
jgi:hypothetical protein